MMFHLYDKDLPASLDLGKSVAIDTETMGLCLGRDRLCLIQVSSGDGVAHLVRIPLGTSPEESPVLTRCLADPSILKIFHFARFDLAALFQHFRVMATPVYCTKIVSRLVRTYTDRHGLKELCRELLGIDLMKQEQTSDWGAEVLRDEQLRYAAADVLYLHKIKEKLDLLLTREERHSLAQSYFHVLPARAHLDLMAGEGFDPLTHS